MRTGPERNDLLALLDPREKARVFPLLRKVELPLGEQIDGAGQELKFVYFPADCIISLLYVTLDGHSAEIAVVGRDGIVGAAAVMGANSTPSQAIVQSAGTAYRMASSELRREFNNEAAMRVRLLCYTQALISQMAQTAMCNRYHSIQQQLCRWLLLSLDRLPTNELAMTQELIANMLGVRREGVTEAAGKLKELGVIHYRRGHITVLDRPQLEQLCCECYSPWPRNKPTAWRPEPIGSRYGANRISA